MSFPNIKEFLQKEDQKDIQADSFIDHMIFKIDQAIARDQRVLILAITKKSS